MTILVTRPSPAGETLVARLTKLGHQAFYSPLIEIARGAELDGLPEQLKALSAGDLVIALSQHAVHYADAVLKATSQTATGQRWPGSPAYYAIGRTTALALHQVTSAIVTYPPERETSETLLELPELQNISGKNALLLRGNGGRTLVAETLTQRGARVGFCECYQRRMVHYDGPEQSRHWQQRGIDRIIITSGEMLEWIYTLVPEYYRTTWLLDCQMIVVSERLAQQAQQLGWRDIRIADNADNDALIRLLSC